MQEQDRRQESDSDKLDDSREWVIIEPEATAQAPEDTEASQEVAEPVPEAAEPVPEAAEPAPEAAEPAPEAAEPAPETAEPAPEAEQKRPVKHQQYCERSANFISVDKDIQLDKTDEVVDLRVDHSHAVFSTADLKETSMLGVNCQNADFTNANLSDARAEKYQLQRGCSFNEATFLGANLTGFSSQHSSFNDASFVEAWLRNVTVKHCDFVRACFSYGHLSGYFDHVDFTDATMKNVHITDEFGEPCNVRMIDVNFTNVDLTTVPVNLFEGSNIYLCQSTLTNEQLTHEVTQRHYVGGAKTITEMHETLEKIKGIEGVQLAHDMDTVIRVRLVHLMKQHNDIQSTYLACGKIAVYFNEFYPQFYDEVLPGILQNILQQQDSIESLCSSVVQLSDCFPMLNIKHFIDVISSSANTFISQAASIEDLHRMMLELQRLELVDVMDNVFDTAKQRLDDLVKSRKPNAKKSKRQGPRHDGSGSSEDEEVNRDDLTGRLTEAEFSKCCQILRLKYPRLARRDTFFKDRNTGEIEGFKYDLEKQGIFVGPSCSEFGWEMLKVEEDVAPVAARRQEQGDLPDEDLLDQMQSVAHELDPRDELEQSYESDNDGEDRDGISVSLSSFGPSLSGSNNDTD